MKKLCLVFVLVLLFMSGAHSDDWDYKPWWLRLSPSVQANGMGLVGVVRVDDQAIYYNPGALGFVDTKLSSVSIYPGEVELGGSGRYLFEGNTYVMRLLPNGLMADAPLGIVIGYQEISYIGWSRLLYFCRGARTARRGFEEHSAQRAALGVGYSGSFDIGVGVSISRISLSLASCPGDIDETDNGINGGLLLRVPLGGRPDPTETGNKAWLHELSFGISFSNYGMDMYAHGLRYDSLKSGRFGVGIESSYRSRDTEVLTVFSTYEKEAIFSGPDKGINKFGLELGLMEILFLRGGIIGKAGRKFKPNTFGFTVSTQGIKKVLLGDRLDSSVAITSPFVYLLTNLEVQFSFARASLWRYTMEPTNYYSIDVTL